jgi:hypothetical protein
MKSSILNLVFPASGNEVRKPDARISNPGICGAGRFGLMGRRLFHTGEAPTSGQ